MSAILLLHSALGLRPAVLDFADRLREKGHQVDTPDFYDGNVFEDEQAGIAYRDSIGPRDLLRRLDPALEALPEDAVLAGFSLGSAFAQSLARKRPRARAVVLMHSVAAAHGDWSGQPVQVHRYAEDRWIDPTDVAALGRAVRATHARFEDHVVPGHGHLFTDPALPEGDVVATDATLERIHALLAQS